MSNYNNEALIDLQNQVQSLQSERDRLREAGEEMMESTDWSHDPKICSARIFARQALEGGGK